MMQSVKVSLLGHKAGRRRTEDGSGETFCPLLRGINLVVPPRGNTKSHQPLITARCCQSDIIPIGIALVTDTALHRK